MNIRTGRYITISVDDGHPKDLKTAELLSKYDLQATFYVSRNNAERIVLQPVEVRELAQMFEIGGHTFNHRVLKGLSQYEITGEVVNGKRYLEQLLGREISSFCYPKGKFNQAVIDVVERAGFLGARTCMFNLTEYPRNPYLCGVSTHCYPHSVYIQLQHAVLERNWKGAANFFFTHRAAIGWVEHFRYAVQKVLKSGGIAHLYLHSWEIDELEAWQKLENLFEYVHRIKELKPITNGELFSRLS